ncbi:DUF4350 domain-containing protein [Sessilibacter corallicola]|uniref:DUF4350 domain-containing protein n=1 Tax=Sessilibacter corallicola TaxID=2904075 RepID=UPI001E3D79D9|nr:DUF4350 domain-containing protein [Sessilibacter corallicola]MCE2029536.1 hypothetical protein [Sessilibacter corallicola]
MPNKLLAILAGLVFLLIGLFFLLFESYTTTVDRGWSKEARSNRYLAAEKFLTLDDKNPNISYGFNSIENLSEIDVLIISNYSNIVSVKQEDKLSKWVSEGGHLILALPNSDSSQYLDSKLLTELGIGVGSSSVEESESEQPLIEGDEIDSYYTKLNFDGVDETLVINFGSYAPLYHEYFFHQGDEEYDGYVPFYWARNNEGIQFLQLNVQSGLVTVLPNVSIWQNAYISDDDNAYLLHLLTGSQKEIQFLVGTDFVPLTVLIWKNAYELIISIALLLVIWLIYRAKRFLPAVATTINTRRSLNEHINASAQFHWKYKHTEFLLESLREEIFKKYKFRFSSSNMQQQTISEDIAKTMSLQISAVESALFEAKITTESDFIKTVQILKTVNSNL